MYTYGRTDPVATCRGWPADMPSKGRLHSTDGARNQTSNTELEKAPSEEGKVSLFILQFHSHSLYPFIQVTRCYSNIGPTWCLLNIWFHGAPCRGGVEQCGTIQDTGKENVDPASNRRHPRKPRVKKVCTNADVFSMCFGAHRTRLASFRAPNTKILCYCALKC